MGTIPERCVRTCDYLAERAKRDGQGMDGMQKMAGRDELRTVDNRDASECPTPGPKKIAATGRLACHMAFVTPGTVQDKAFTYQKMPQHLVPFAEEKK